MSKECLKSITKFWQAPDESLFSQEDLVPVLGLSRQWFERERWKGGGIPYLKLSKRCVRYKKLDVINWLNKHKKFTSTTCESVAEESSGAA